jgi:3-dehydroquinate dehydratase I
MICISICASTQKKALRDIKKGLPLCDLLELRMDRIRGGDLPELIQYMRCLAPDKPVLVTSRMITEKPDQKPNVLGKKRTAGAADEVGRWEMLQEAVRLGAEFVDVELEDDDSRVSELFGLIGQYGNKTRLICSHHDFCGTPTLKQLKNIYLSCLKKGGDVVKIVPYANAPEDNLRVLELLDWAKGREKAIIAFCMGEEGHLSRIAAPLFGAMFTFAALDRRTAAAPGQMAAKDVKNILGILRRGER